MRSYLFGKGVASKYRGGAAFHSMGYYRCRRDTGILLPLGVPSGASALLSVLRMLGPTPGSLGDSSDGEAAARGVVDTMIGSVPDMVTFNGPSSWAFRALPLASLDFPPAAFSKDLPTRPAMTSSVPSLHQHTCVANELRRGAGQRPRAASPRRAMPI
jgi:hypothetical protein